MKKSLLKVIFLLTGLQIMAQQEAHYSQYMFNGLVLNPAYAGSREYMSSVLITRQQWTGFDGAPRNQSISFHTPSINLRNGFGIFFANDKLGGIREKSFSFAYAYRIPFGKESFFSLGLRAGGWNYQMDYSELQNPQSSLLINSQVYDPSDPAFAGANPSLWQPNAGCGIYINTKSMYTGISLPQIIPNSLSTSANGDARRYLHLLITQGFIIRLSKGFHVRPSALLKAIPGSAAQLDLNLSFLFNDRIWVGGTYRTGEGYVMLVEILPNSWLRLGYSYDVTTSRISLASTGSHEIMLGFDLNFKGNSHISPRHF